MTARSPVLPPSARENDARDPWDPSRTQDRRLLWTGAILMVIGLSLVLVVGEWFAMLDACVANPTCTVGASAEIL